VDKVTYVAELERTIEDFMRKRDKMFSKGFLNSDGMKALVRILKMAVRAGLIDKSSGISRYLKSREEGEVLAILLSLEERLCARS